MFSSSQNQVCLSPIYYLIPILFLKRVRAKLVNFLVKTNWKVISQKVISQNVSLNFLDFGYSLKALKDKIEKVWEIYLVNKYIVNGLETLQVDKKNLTIHRLISDFQWGKTSKDDVVRICQEWNFIKRDGIFTEAGIFLEITPRDQWILGIAFKEKFWSVKKLIEGFLDQPIVTGE